MQNKVVCNSSRMCNAHIDFAMVNPVSKIVFQVDLCSMQH